jgi:hypothetical protein
MCCFIISNWDYGMPENLTPLALIKTINYYKLCERLQKLIGEKVMDAQQLIAHHCKK